MENYPKSSKYSREFLKPRMMGPNAIKLLEELLEPVEIRPGTRVLDLGCGQGLTSIFLAREYGVLVYAVDLWIPATQNFATFQSWGLEDRIIPIHADAHALGFAEGYFDVVCCVDSYHYYGREGIFMDAKLAPFVKPGGMIALAFPGLTEENPDPAQWRAGISKEAFDAWHEGTLHSLDWWEALLRKSKSIELQSVYPMEGTNACWADWFSCDNEYVVKDLEKMRAGAGDYMNFIAVHATKKQ